MGYRFKKMGLVQLDFTVSGQPVGKGRPRFTGHGHSYTPLKTRQYENRVGAAAWAAMKQAGLQPSPRRMSVIITAYFEVPKSYSKKKRAECEAGIHIPKRPDLDNVAKIICDGANEIAWIDDAQIWHLTAFKRYCDDGQEPHVAVRVQWDDPDMTNRDHTNLATF